MIKLGFIGGGNMAQAMVAGVLAAQQRSQIWLIEPEASTREKLTKISPHVKVFASHDLVEDWQVDLLIIAVKPQQCREALAPLAKHLQQQMVLSIAAGLSLACLSKWLGEYQKIIRSMPNTPALVKRGITALFRNCQLSTSELDKLQLVVSSIGQYLWLNDEQQMDAITSVSGSGPAYVCYFIEALICAAEAQGLDAPTAKNLVMATIEGSYQLIQQSTEDVATLRQQVTSKGGTTEAALAVLSEHKFTTIINQAVSAAAARSKQLGIILTTD